MTTMAQRVNEAALDDDLDVEKPVAHDCGRIRQRHETERNRKEIHHRRHCSEPRERDRIAERERRAAERSAPRDPAELTTGGDGAHLRQGAREPDQTRDHARRKVDVVGVVENADHVDECGVA